MNIEIAQGKWCPFTTERYENDTCLTKGCMMWRETSRDYGFCGLAGREELPNGTFTMMNIR